MILGQFQQHLLLMGHGGVQTPGADKGMEAEPSIFKNLSQVSAFTKTEKIKVADVPVQ